MRLEHPVAGRLRALGLVDAAERAGLAPIPISRLHAFAFLSDILSPMWGLEPFDAVALKTKGQPFFAAFQDHVDALVVLGLLDVVDFAFSEAGAVAGALSLNSSYHLRYQSTQLASILDFLSEDDHYRRQGAFFVSLAVAMSRLPDADIVRAATKDDTWQDDDVPPDHLYELFSVTGRKLRTATDGRLDEFAAMAPATVTSAGMLRLYAAYLGERLKAA